MRTRLPVALVAVALLASACEQGNVFDLEEGTCFDDPGVGEEITDVPVIDCEEPHDNEVYETFAIPDGDYPGDEAVATAADEGCIEAFDDWAGIAYADSRLFASYFAPTQQSWEQLEDREVVCYVYDVDGEPMTGSMEQSGI